MINYSILIFIIKYIVCLVLFYLTIKTKRTETLFRAFLAAFIVSSFILGVNFLISFLKEISGQTPFYYFNFIDFVSLTLLGNFFIKKKTKL